MKWHPAPFDPIIGVVTFFISVARIFMDILLALCGGRLREWLIPRTADHRGLGFDS